MNKIAFCITGWHFPVSFYEKIGNIPGVDVFVISHKPFSLLPDYVSQTLPIDNIIVKPNYGYDWGCFQQFIETKIWRSYDYLFFMHDDINILDISFVGASIELLGQGYSVVGNGRPFEKTDWPRTHVSYYAHAAWQLPSLNFKHGVVRGSFFATRKEVLETIKSFEVFWDRFHLSVGFGNYSLLATCGKLGDLFGEKAFAYLSEAYRVSPYILEFERGEDTEEDKTVVQKKDQRYVFNHLFMPLYKNLANMYMLARMKSQKHITDKIVQAIGGKFIHLIADI